MELLELRRVLTTITLLPDNPFSHTDVSVTFESKVRSTVSSETLVFDVIGPSGSTTSAHSFEIDAIRVADRNITKYVGKATDSTLDLSMPSVPLAPGKNEFKIVLTRTDTNQEQNFLNAPQVVILRNRLPIITSAAPFSTNEEQAFTIFTLTDPDGDPLTVTTSSATNGTLSYSSITKSFSYQPNQDFSGTDSVSVTVSDGLESSTSRVTVTVVPINDAPTLNSIANPSAILEDAAAQTVALTGITTGPNETQVLTVTAVSSNPGLIPNPTISYTSPNATGSLAYTPVANQSGTATITVTVNDNGGRDNGGIDAVTRSFTVTVNAVNDPPTLNPISNLVIAEDVASQTMNLAGITAGGGESQPLRVTASSSNTSLIATPAVNYTSASTAGSLTFTPVGNQSGFSVVTVSVEDGGLDGNLSTVADNATFARSFTVTVDPVNDAPTLDLIANPASLPKNAPSQTISLSGITAGPSETQVLTVTATSSNPGLIPDPTITYTSPNATGSLVFTPATNQAGTATITVTVKDNGGRGNGGIDTFTRTFSVAIDTVNREPTLDSIANPAAIDEDATAQSVRLTGISPGLNETLQTITVTAVSNNPGLIPDPTISYTSPDATGTLLYTPVVNQSGTATIAVTVQDDGGMAGGGIDAITRTFTVIVNPVNDAPTLDSIANPAPVPGNAGVQTIDLTGISAGPNENQFLTVTAKSSNPGLIPDPTIMYSSPDSTGILNFAPALNQSATATITVTVKEEDGTAGGVTFSRSFLITVEKFNFPPVFASSLDVNVLQGGSVNIDGTQGAVDPEGNTIDPSSILISNAPLSGTALLQSVGGKPTIVYTPDPVFQGVDQFQYTIADVLGARSLPRRVSIGIVDRPVITALVDDVLPATGTLSFSTPIFTNDVLPVLSGTAEPGATIQLVSQPSMNTLAVTADAQGKWQIALASPLATTTQAYVVSVNATSPGVPVITSTAVSFTIDATAPSVQPIPNFGLRNIPLSEDVVFQFVEGTAADPVTGIDLGDVSLVVNGSTANLLTPTNASLIPTSNNTFVLRIQPSVTAETGTYSLSLNPNASGIADRAGNLLATGVSTSFAVDVTAPVLKSLLLTTVTIDSKLPVPVIESTSPTGAQVSYKANITDQQFAGFENSVLVTLVEIVAVSGTTTQNELSSVSVTIPSGPKDSLNFAISPITLTGHLPLGKHELKVLVSDKSNPNRKIESASQFVFVNKVGAATQNAPGTPAFSEKWFIGATATEATASGSTTIKVDQAVPAATIISINGKAYEVSASSTLRIDPNTSVTTLTLKTALQNAVVKDTKLMWLRPWTTTFDKSTQTTWLTMEDGVTVAQFDPATGDIKIYDIGLRNANGVARYGDPHGVSFDFSSHLTPRVWFVYRNENLDRDLPKFENPDDPNGHGPGTVGYLDVATETLWTVELNDISNLSGPQSPELNGTHAVFVDARGHVWATTDNSIIEIDTSRDSDGNPTESLNGHSGSVILHNLPQELGDTDNVDVVFRPHGLQVIVDSRTGKPYVLMADGDASNGSARIVLLQPGVDGTADQWKEWNFNDLLMAENGSTVGATLFLAVDDNETPGKPEDDRLIAASPGALAGGAKGIMRVLDLSSVLGPLVKFDLAQFNGKTLPSISLPTTAPVTTYRLPSIPGSAQTNASNQVPFVDRAGNVFFVDALGGLGRFNINDPNTDFLISQTNVALANFESEPSQGDLNFSSTGVKLEPLRFTAKPVIGSPINADRSPTTGIDHYEVAMVPIAAQGGSGGRGLFRGTLDAENSLYGSISSSDYVASTLFAESTRRQLAVLPSPFPLPKGAIVGGRAALQVLRDGSVILTARGDGEALDVQVNLTKELLAAGKIANFDSAAVLGEMAALEVAGGGIVALGRLADGSLVRYTFTPPVAAWRTIDLKNIAHWAASRKIAIPNGQLVAEDPIPAPGIGFTLTTSDGHLIVVPMVGDPVDLSASAGPPAVYAGVGGVVAGARLRFYGGNQTGSVVEYSTNLSLGDIQTRTLVVASTVSVRPAGDSDRDIRVFRNIRPLVDGATIHLFATDGVARLVHYQLDSNGNVTLAENVTRLVQNTGRVFGYFAFEKAYGGRVYTYVSAIKDADGNIRVYGTNGGELIEFTLDAAGKWRVGNLTNNILSTNVTQDGSSRIPANFVFGAPSAYRDATGERHVLQINADGEIVEYYMLARDPQRRFHTQNVNLRIGEGSQIENLRFHSNSIQSAATVDSNATSSTSALPSSSASLFASSSIRSLDVNLDGENSPLDVLLVINYLNTRQEDPNSGGPSSDLRFDVSGDGWISPLDVLILINNMNRTRGDAEGERSDWQSTNSNGPEEKLLDGNAVDCAFADLGEWDNFQSDKKKRPRA